MGSLLWTNETEVLLGIAAIIALVLVQWVIGSGAKAKQPGAIPGKIPNDLSHDSFVFRAHRTFMNSLENVPLFLATVFLAMFAQLDASWLAIWVWVFWAARLIHMVLYYAIATETNPSPRSYFFMLGFMVNIALLVHVIIALVG